MPRKLNLITTAVIRPNILDITYSSFKEKLFKDWPVPAGYHPDIDDAIADDIARASGGKVVWRDKDPDPLEPGDKY